MYNNRTVLAVSGGAGEFFGVLLSSRPHAFVKVIQASLFSNPEELRFWEPPWERETPDGIHRLWLDRLTGLGDTTLGWVMCNPSTADSSRDDPTIRRVIDFTCRGDYDRAVVANLWTFRSTDPAGLDPAARAFNHPEADNMLRWLAAHSGAIVLAWGAGSSVPNHVAYRKRANEVTAMLQKTGVRLLNLGETAAGFPRHPLFVPAATRLASIRESHIYAN